MKRALIFPGQGAQFVGMGKDFFEAFSEAKETFLEADDLLDCHLSKLIFSGPADELLRTEWSQLAIFVTSIATLRCIEKDIHYDAVAGLSLGEYTALVASKKCTFKEALFLVKKRGELMSAACDRFPGTMAVILGLDFDAVASMVKALSLPQDLWVANANAPGQVVISGTLKGVEAGKEAAKASGAKRALPLEVHGAFHSGLMASAEKELAPYVDEVKLTNSSTSLYMNVPGDRVEDLLLIRRYLKEQVTRPVLWMRSVQSMVRDGISEFIEVGPGTTLAGMLKRIEGASHVYSLSTLDHFHGFTTKR